MRRIASPVGLLVVLCWSQSAFAQVEAAPAFVLSWGTSGFGEGQFREPQGGGLDDATGNVYVADSNNNRIQKFDNDGNFLTKWGTCCGGDGQFRGPFDVAVDAAGNV